MGRQRESYRKKREAQGKTVGVDLKVSVRKKRGIREYPVKIGLHEYMVTLYTPSQLAFVLKVCSATIIKWESMGVIPKPTFRTGAGWRVYTEDQVRVISEVYARYFSVTRITNGIRWSTHPFVSDLKKEWAKLTHGLRPETLKSLQEKT